MQAQSFLNTHADSFSDWFTPYYIEFLTKHLNAHPLKPPWFTADHLQDDAIDKFHFVSTKVMIWINLTSLESCYQTTKLTGIMSRHHLGKFTTY